MKDAMRAIHLHGKDLAFTVQLIENRGTTEFEDFEKALGQYYEHYSEVDYALAIIDFIAFLIFLAYVVYHLISKMRGNEKNVKMNNFGIALGVLGLWCSTVYFISAGTLSVMYEKHYNWRLHYETLYWWIWWSVDSAYLLYHWFFNWRYVKSTFRLPVLEKSAEFHSHMLDRIFK